VTTARSPLRALKAQANQIAMTLKAVERGAPISGQFAFKITEARRTRRNIKFAVVMDDKTLIIELPWKQIEETSEAGIAEFILKHMRGARDPQH